MDARERYFWDLTGYLVVKGVLSEEEVARANDIVDRYWDRVQVGGSTARESVVFAGTGRPMLPGVLEFPKPDCEPFREMLAHPVLVKYLNVMCDKGFRLDHGPMFIVSNKGTAGHTMHGNGDPHRPHVAYHHQNGKTWVGGVTVAWQLHDCKEGMGGFACVPSSHKAMFPMPKGVHTGDDDMDLIKQPVVEAGDVIFFMDSAQAHGATPWKLDTTRRSILFKYTGRTCARGGPSQEVSPPEIYWDRKIVEDMTPEQLSVMYGPYSNHKGRVPYLEVCDDGSVRIEGYQ